MTHQNPISPASPLDLSPHLAPQDPLRALAALRNLRYPNSTLRSVHCPRHRFLRYEAGSKTPAATVQWRRRTMLYGYAGMDAEAGTHKKTASMLEGVT